MPQKPGQILDPQTTLSSAYYCGYVVDGHIPCDTNVVLIVVLEFGWVGFLALM
jgi:hypothetical protein